MANRKPFYLDTLYTLRYLCRLKKFKFLQASRKPLYLDTILVFLPITKKKKDRNPRQAILIYNQKFMQKYFFVFFLLNIHLT